MSDGGLGLTSAEARARLQASGPNRIRERKRETFLDTFLEEVREPMILLLLGTGVLYSVWGELRDAVTIFAVILTLVGVEVFNEHRAHEAIAALRDLSAPTALALRDGRTVEIPAEQVVVGDALVLLPGRRVAADARVVGSEGLAADESVLTGESVPVDRFEAAMVHAGTIVTRGRGTAVVTATGMRTELGQIAALAEEARPPKTPLQLAMKELTGRLVIVALAASVLVPVLGFAVADQPVKQMVLVGLSLAFATIPEEMPIIIAMVLGLGGYRLSKRRAIVKRLRAVETLGSVTLIATDKTGTLTENRMRVARVEPPDFRARVLEVGALASGALDAFDTIADPIDRALVEAAAGEGVNVEWLRTEEKVLARFDFDERRLASVVARTREGLRVATKGAPEAVLDRCDRHWTVRGERELDEEGRAELSALAASMAAEGFRVVALAERALPEGDPPARDEAERDLIFTGLAGLADPPREEVPAAVEACREAGIRTLMITGDHPETARAIAAAVGIEVGDVLSGSDLDGMDDAGLEQAVASVHVFARITPAHKLRIVEAAQRLGNVVAVTGDGVNDAPALAAADVGVAMGGRGTDVARDAADIVLADDDFATIEGAVEEGRVLFANLRKGVRYYLACKLALIGATLLPALLAVPVPFAPVQIIVMELFMDLAAAATFVAEPAEPGLMRRPPRNPSQPFMDRGYVVSIVRSAVGLFAAVTASYLIVRGADPTAARSTAFVTWMAGHVFLALNLRSEDVPLARLGLASNRLMLAWGAAAGVFAVFAIVAPFSHAALRTVALSGGRWGLALGAAFAGTFWMEAYKWLRTGRRSA